MTAKLSLGKSKVTWCVKDTKYGAGNRNKWMRVDAPTSHEAIAIAREAGLKDPIVAFLATRMLRGDR